MKAPTADMMNTLSRSVLTLASYDDRASDLSIGNVLRQSLMLISVFPMLAVYGYHSYNHYERDESLYIHRPDENLSAAENLLRMLRPDKAYTELEARVLDLALILHMEHGGGNNSSFTTHVVTSSGTDTYSAIAAALASLKGPKHGGANIKVVQMMADLKRNVTDTTDEEAVEKYLHKLLNREAFDQKGLIYGMDIRPDTANVERDGAVLTVSPEEVAPGETLVVKPGERVPLDGVVIEGVSALNTSALTGESLPRDVTPGDEVISGCVNQSGLLRVRATKPYGESTVSKILDLVENASAKKARTESFITRFARVYTPVVCGLALLLFLLPPLLTGGGWRMWGERALSFLVVSCPCALVISVPLTFFGGIGGASRKGILVKGGTDLEQLARAEIVVFDKTGTLTQGSFKVTVIHPEKVSEQELLRLAATVETFSDHPISRSIRAQYHLPVDASGLSDVREIAGQGVSATLDGHTVYAGNLALMDTIGVTVPTCPHAGTVVHVAQNGEYLGHIVISDEMKPGSREAIAALRREGIRKTVMLTGDSQAVADDVAGKLGIDEVHAHLLPAGKVEQVEALLLQTTGKGKLVFVGDGVNDAPVLTRADIGVAMGFQSCKAAIAPPCRAAVAPQYRAFCSADHSLTGSKTTRTRLRNHPSNVKRMRLSVTVTEFFTPYTLRLPYHAACFNGFQSSGEPLKR